MQRWKCAVGAIVMLAVAGGSVAGCSKGGNTKQNAAQAKAKPKADPKASAKKDPKAAKADPKTAKAEPKADPKADPKAAKPSQNAANTKPAAPAPAPAPAQKTAAANTKPAAPAPAQTAANAKPATTKPSVEAAAANVKPAPASPAPAKAPVSESNNEWQKSLQANKALTAQVQSRLPAGTDVMKASAGFRNLQQFVSAVHASQNLAIPFDKMRTALVDEQKSLSTAIRTLKPTATATIEAQRADYEARGTIFQAQQQPATPAADSTAKKAKSSTK